MEKVNTQGQIKTYFDQIKRIATLMSGDDELIQIHCKGQFHKILLMNILFKDQALYRDDKFFGKLTQELYKSTEGQELFKKSPLRLLLDIQ